MTAPSPATAEELRKAQQEEFGVYVAVAAIDINGARAFNAGDPVNVSHVERGVVRGDQVAKATTKAGREALRASGLNVPEPQSAAVDSQKG